MRDLVSVANVRGYIREDGVAMLNAEDVARGWGFVQRQNKNGKVYESIRWETLNRYLNGFGFPQQVGEDDFLPENMVYRLGFKANNETAQRFQALLADKVLPQIRKTGSYSVLPKDYLSALKALVASEEEKIRLTEENKLMKPKADFYDAVAESDNVVDMAKAAKILGIPKMGRTNLFKFLREKRVLDKNNVPYQQYVTNGYFKSVLTRHGKVIVSKTVVYGRGINFINNLIKKDVAEKAKTFNNNLFRR